MLNPVTVSLTSSKQSILPRNTATSFTSATSTSQHSSPSCSAHQPVNYISPTSLLNDWSCLLLLCSKSTKILFYWASGTTAGTCTFHWGSWRYYLHWALPSALSGDIQMDCSVQCHECFGDFPHAFAQLINEPLSLKSSTVKQMWHFIISFMHNSYHNEDCSYWM